MKSTIGFLSAFDEIVKTIKYKTYLRRNSHSIRIRNSTIKFMSNIAVELNRFACKTHTNPDFQSQRIWTQIIDDNDDVLHIFVYN